MPEGHYDFLDMVGLFVGLFLDRQWVCNVLEESKVSLMFVDESCEPSWEGLVLLHQLQGGWCYVIHTGP